MNLAWKRHLAAWGVVVVAVLLLLQRDARHLFSIWWDNATFGHCLLIVPIVIWLVWQRRHELARMAPSPWLPGVAILFATGILWLLGELAELSVVRHAALILMIIATVPTMFGLSVARGVAFPLFFLLFGIPIGEQIVPQLQTFTALFSIKLLDLFGVPAYLDGVFISIPNGDFQVAQACSGVRFLIAMVAFGALASNICFKLWWRRAAFMAASVVVPIVANGIRAWGTIYIAHLTTASFAKGMDHIIYGWFFFAFVMALTLAIGWRFFDRPVDEPMIDPARLQSPDARPGTASEVARAAVAAVVLSAAAPAYGAYVAERAPDSIVARIDLPTPKGWRRVAYQGVPWAPRYAGAHSAMASYVDAGGQPVDLYLAVYDRETAKLKLVGYGLGIAPPDEHSLWAWASSDTPPPGGSAAQINAGEVVREAWQYFLVNGKVVATPYAVKAESLKSKLLHGPTRAATLVISAQRRDPMIPVRPAIARFAAAAGPVGGLIENATVEVKN